MKLFEILNETHPAMEDTYDLYDELMDDLSVQELVNEIIAAREGPKVDWDWIASRQGKEEFEHRADTNLSDEEYDAIVTVLHKKEKTGFKNLGYAEGCEIVFTDEDGSILFEGIDPDDEYLGMKGRKRWIKDAKEYGYKIEKDKDGLTLNAIDGEYEVGAHMEDDSHPSENLHGYLEPPLEEAAIRQFKRFGNAIKRQYRCTSGPKKGKIVASPQACGQRKDPRKVRHGKKVARMKKGVRIRKTKIAKKKTVSKMVNRMNKRLSGK